MQSSIDTSNRIDAALQQWDRQHEKYLNRYGTAIIKDRDYQKICRDVHKQIYEQFKGDRSLSVAEKMDLRVIKGQLNQMNRSLYTRAGRTLRLGAGIAQTIVKGLMTLPFQIGSRLLFRRPLPNNNALSRQPIPVRRTNLEAFNGSSPDKERIPVREVLTASAKKVNPPQTSPDGSTLAQVHDLKENKTDQHRIIQRNFRNKVRKVLDTERTHSKRL